MGGTSGFGATEQVEAVGALDIFAEILEQSSRAVVLIALTGSIPYANPRFCQLTGYGRSELPGMTIFDFGARPQESEMPMWEAVSTGKSWQGHIPGRRKNGERFWCEAFVAPIHDGNAETTFYLAAFDEVPEPVSQPAFPKDVSPDMVLLTDTGGTILYVNQTVPGITRESATGDTIFNYVPEEYRGPLREYMDQAIQSGQPVTYEIASVGPHGTVSWYVTKVGPIRRGGEIVALSFITADLTQQKGLAPPPVSAITTRKRKPARRKPARARRGAGARPAPELVDLSTRELQVLKLLAQGLTNRQVATRLRVSLRTIDHHVSHILNKLSVPNRTAAAMTARRSGLL
jgi:PAS domain S-box-containing protein